MNKALTAEQVQSMFDATDRAKEAKDQRRIRLERKKQDKQEYLAGIRFRATWEEE